MQWEAENEHTVCAAAMPNKDPGSLILEVNQQHIISPFHTCAGPWSWISILDQNEVCYSHVKMPPNFRRFHPVAFATALRVGPCSPVQCTHLHASSFAGGDLSTRYTSSAFDIGGYHFEGTFTALRNSTICTVVSSVH